MNIDARNEKLLKRLVRIEARLCKFMLARGVDPDKWREFADVGEIIPSDEQLERRTTRIESRLVSFMLSEGLDPYEKVSTTN